MDEQVEYVFKPSAKWELASEINIQKLQCGGLLTLLRLQLNSACISIHPLSSGQYIFGYPLILLRSFSYPALASYP